MKKIIIYSLFLSIFPSSIIWSQTKIDRVNIETLCDGVKNDSITNCNKCLLYLIEGKKYAKEKEYGEAIYNFGLARATGYKKGMSKIDELVTICTDILHDLRWDVINKTRVLEEQNQVLSDYEGTLKFKDNTLRNQRDSLNSAFKIIHEKGWKAESYRLPSLADSTRLTGNYRDAAYLAYYGILLQKDKVQIPALNALMEAGTKYDSLYSTILPFEKDSAEITLFEVLGNDRFLFGSEKKIAIYTASKIKLLELSIEPFRLFMAKNKKNLAVTDKNGNIEVWNLENLQKQTIHRDQTAPITVCRFSEDGKLLVTVSRKENAIIHDLSTNIQTPLPTKGTRVYGIVIANNGERILTRHNGGISKLWNKDGGELKSFGNKEIHIHTAGFSESTDQSIHTANTLGQLKEWDTKTGEVKSSFQESEPIKETWILPDFMVLRTTYSLIIKHNNGRKKQIPLGKRILGVKFNQQNNNALIWLAGGDLVRIDLVKNIKYPLHKHNTNVVNAAFSMDEKWIVSTEENGTVTLLDAFGHIVLKRNTKRESQISAQFSQNGQYLYLLSKEGIEIQQCPLPPTILNKLQSRKVEILKYLSTKKGYELQYLKEV